MSFDTLKNLVLADCIACEEAIDGGVDLVLVPDGYTENLNGRSWTINEAAWRRIESRFKERGVAVPVDVMHESVDESIKPKDAIGAVGWIEAMRYEIGRGVIGNIRWTDEGKLRVRSDRFRYLSPVLDVDKQGDVVGIHSVGLVTKPAIRKMDRVAASEELPDDSKDQDQDAKLISIVAKISLALGIDAFPTDAMEGLLAILGALTPDKSLANAQAEIRIACMVREKLGLAAGADAEAVCNAIEAKKFIEPWLANGMVKANSEEHQELVRLSAVDRTLANRYLKMVERDANSRVEELIENEGVRKGIINPNAKTDMRICREIAIRDPELFLNWLRERPVQLPPGRTKPPSVDQEKRRQKIKSAVEAFEGDDRIRRVTNKTTFINSSLSECAMEKMTDEEERAYAKL